MKTTFTWYPKQSKGTWGNKKQEDDHRFIGRGGV